MSTDPDSPAPSALRSARPLHQRSGLLGLALLGGTAGTAAREALGLAVPSLAGIPVAIFAINLLGAFLLGLLLEALLRTGPDDGWRLRARILLGTGFMGGFTTYSALAVDTALLLGGGATSGATAGAMTTAGATTLGLAYGLGTVLLGGLATWAGIAIGTLTHRPTAAPAKEAGR
ncbi:CrcB family protein [Brevibacterium sp. 2SA]|uniref:FluC/FEX family fluoride channel n=1 Tax=Brevibacterium sp. 2SA TaxID=2502198 RepID=UPI0010F830B9|nr:CrcB family protein [Brevibacterium sp. 2SA]